MIYSLLNIYLHLSFTLLACGTSCSWTWMAWQFIWSDKSSQTEIVTTVTWLALSLLTTWIITNVWPAVPLFPVTIYFGIIFFAITLWYAFVWGAFPFGNLPGGANVIIGAVVIFLISGLLWKLLVNLNATPWEKAVFNPQDYSQQIFVFGLMVWIIAWMLISAFGLQGYPFYKLGQPLGPANCNCSCNCSRLLYLDNFNQLYKSLIFRGNWRIDYWLGTLLFNLVSVLSFCKIYATKKRQL